MSIYPEILVLVAASCLHQFYLVELDLAVAVAALQDSFFLVEHVETCLHGLVVGDALVVRT